MPLSKRHFEALAASLKDLKADLDKASADNCDNATNFAYERHVRRVAALCKVENPAFQFSLFYDAAGLYKRV